MIKLFNEDCKQTLAGIESGTIDLLLQDTPFGVTQNDWDIKPDLESLWPEWLRVSKENCAFIFFATQPFASDLIESNRKLFRYDLIWYKQLGTGFLNANKMPLRNHESILVFYKKLPVYNPQMSIGKMKGKGRLKTTARQSPNNYGSFKDLGTKVNNIYHPESVIDFSNGNNAAENEHPTQKPIDLIRYLVKTYSNENDLVFDGYMGSGTTAAACVMEGRRFIGSELKKEYFDIAERRVKELIDSPTLFNSNSKVA